MNGLKDQQTLFALSQAHHSFSTTSSFIMTQILVVEYLYLIKPTSKLNELFPKYVYECKGPKGYNQKIKYLIAVQKLILSCKK